MNVSSNNSNGTDDINVEVPTDSYERLPGWKGTLQAINDKWTEAEKMGLYLFMIILCGTAFTQWILRNFFSAGYVWIDEIIKYPTLWAGFIGASIATSRVSHFRIDLVRLVKNRNIVNKIRALSYFAAVVFCVVFAYATIDYISTLIEYDEKDYYGFAVWPVYTVVFYFYLMTGSRFFLMGIFKLV